MKEFWNQRYREPTFAYGTTPNVFFKAQLDQIPAGKLLLPAEGEGRNAIYAASQGWEVSAYDISEAGQKKALQLAKENEVNINYQVGTIQDLQFEIECFDVIGLIFAHFPPKVRKEKHQKLATLLRPGGHIILEAFHPKHIEFNSKNPTAGGPRDVDLLYSMEDLKADFNGFEFIVLEEKTVTLHEGLYHVGESAVVRMVAKKTS